MATYEMTPEQHRQFVGTLYGNEEKSESGFVPAVAKYSPYTMYSNAMLYYDKKGTYGKTEITENKKDTLRPSIVATVEERYDVMGRVTGYVVHTEDEKVIAAAKKTLEKIEEPPVTMVFEDNEVKKNPELSKMKKIVEEFCREHGIRPEKVHNEFGNEVGKSYQINNMQREELMRSRVETAVPRELGPKEKPKAKTKH